MSNVDFDALATQVSLDTPLPDEGFRSLQQPRYGGKIGELQASGFNDDEIAEWSTKKRQELLGANFTEAEINTYFTGAIAVPEKVPVPLIERFLDGKRLQAILTKAGKNTVEAWNSDDPVGIDPGGEFDKFMIDSGLSGKGPLRMLNDSLLRPAAAGLDVLFRGTVAGATGVATAIAQAVKEYGNGSEGMAERGERDILGLAESFGIVFGASPFFSRIKTKGQMAEDQNLGGLPTSQDFADSAKAFTGQGQPEAIQQKLLKLYQEDGVLPSEVVDDARIDPDVAAAMASANPDDLPLRYRAPPLEGDISLGDLSIQKPAAGGGGGPKGPDVEGVNLGAVPDAEANILAKISVDQSEITRPYSWKRFYSDVFDRLWPLPGKSEVANESPYKLFRMLAGAPGKARHMLKYGTIRFDTLDVNGPSLEQVIAPMKKDLNGLRSFLASVRALELHNRGVKTDFSPEDAYKVAVAGRDKYGPVAVELYKYQNRLVDYLQGAGVISAVGAQKMKEMNKVFVPFYKLFDDTNLTLGRALKARNPTALEGHNIIDPLESIIRDTYMFTVLADRNAASLKLVDYLKKLDEVVPQNQPRTVETLPMIPDDTLGDDIRNWIGHNGGPSMADDIGDLEEALKVAAHPSADGKITVLRNGKRETYKVDKDIADALSVLDAGAISLLEKIAAPFARTLRAGIVMSPEFWLRHVFRDYFYGLVTGQTGTFTPLDMAKGFLGQVLKDEDYLKWLRYGGGHTSLTSLDRQFLQEDMDKLIESGLFTRNWNVIMDPESKMFERLKAVGGLPVDFAKHPLKGLNKLFISPLRLTTDIVQSSTQVGAFKKALRQLEKDPAPFTKETRVGAAWTARDTAVDMSRMGAQTRAINMISAFSNATIQDPAKLTEVMGGVGKVTQDPIMLRMGKAFVKTNLIITGGITLPSLLLWTANKDDSRYRSLQPWERDLYWIILTNDWKTVSRSETLNRPADQVRFYRGQWQVNNGAIIRLPKPFTLGVLYGSGPERLAEAYFRDNPEAFKGFASSLWDATVPNFIPQLVDPLIEQLALLNTFSYQRLIPGYLERQLPEYQYTPYTTELAKAVGQTIGAFPGISESKLSNTALTGGIARALSTPILMENYISSWFGTMGTNLLKLSDYSLRKAGVLRDPSKPTMALSDIPIIRAFVARYPSATVDQVQSFYTRHDRLDRFYQTWSARIKDGDLEAAQRVQDMGGVVMFTRLNGVRQTLATHSQLIRDIYENPEIPSDEKRQLIDQLYFSMIQVAEFGNAVLAEVPDDTLNDN